MPIRVTCKCGQNLNVPDAMAGKSGKCPKCKELIQIPQTAKGPAAASNVASTTKSATAKPSTPVAKPAAAAVSPSGLDQLFADAGLDKKKGPECPSCRAAIAANAVICVKCGFNLTTGQKMKGFEVAGATDVGPFANRQLNDAQRSLKKETDADEKAKYTGAPWWVSLAVVLGLVMIIGFGVIIVEGRGAGESEDGVSLRAPSNTLRGKIQALPIMNAMLVVGWMVSGMVVLMAWIATTATAFRDKAVQGILCLLIPIYTHFYAFSHRTTMGSTMRILWGWSVVFAGFMIGMMTTGTLPFLLRVK